MPMTNEESPTGARALRPRARLLRTLGTDLISSEVVALIELVKNSFDADATSVSISFREPMEVGKGAIAVLDDGHGMDVATIESSWLDIATDSKRTHPRSESGHRRVLGEKGIGRLAAARLADEMLLTTRRSNADEVQLLINWRDFDRPGAYLDEIDVAWQVGQPVTFDTNTQQDATASLHGTLIELTSLSRTWTLVDYQALRTALSRLVRPRPHVGTLVGDPFRVTLEIPGEFGFLSGEIEPPDELRSPHYQLVGSVGSDGIAKLQYSQLDPPATFAISGDVLWPTRRRQPASGPIELDIEVWDRDREAIERVSAGRSVRDFRSLLDQVAGVSVYRDGFRVLPFGELGDDWLGLDRRRVQNPTLRLSNNQVIGHVFIGADSNPDLRDQSNREGLLEGPAYDDLRTLIQNALGQIESRRWALRRSSKKPDRPREGLFANFQLDEVRRALSSAYPNDTRLLGIVDAKDRDIREGVEAVQRVLSQYSRLATLGSLIDRVLHDGRTSVARLRNIVRFGHRDLTNPAYTPEEKIELARSAYEATQQQAELLGTLFGQIEPFGGRKRGRPKIVGMRSIADAAVAIFEADAASAGICLEVSGIDVQVTVDQSEILTVLVNLIQNALYWVGSSSGAQPKRVNVAVSSPGEGVVELRVQDSGPGVPPELRDAIFDPYFSSRPDGIGLGLSIAGNIVEELYEGELSLVETAGQSGATFLAVLKRRVG